MYKSLVFIVFVYVLWLSPNAPEAHGVCVSIFLYHHICCGRVILSV